MHWDLLQNLSIMYVPLEERTVLCANHYNILTHCGLVTPYGVRDLGQHWLRQWLVAWRHQAITWTNIDLSSVRSSGIHLRAISREMPQPPFTTFSLKITYMKLNWNLPGANELMLLPFLRTHSWAHDLVCLFTWWVGVKPQIHNTWPQTCANPTKKFHSKLALSQFQRTTSIVKHPGFILEQYMYYVPGHLGICRQNNLKQYVLCALGDLDISKAKQLEAKCTVPEVIWMCYLVICRDHFVYAPSQWETMLQCNVVSYWLGTYTKQSLYM